MPPATRLFSRGEQKNWSCSPSCSILPPSLKGLRAKRVVFGRTFVQPKKTQIVKTPLAKLIQSRWFAGLFGGVLAVGFGFSAHALEVGGRVVEWQHGGDIRTDLPAGSQHNVKAIAAGFAYRLALRTDGTVAYWGLTLAGVVPPGVDALTDVKAVFAGNNNAFVIKSDGRVVGWGDNTYGQLDIPPAASSGVRTLSTSAGRVVAIKEDGTVFGWGRALVFGSNEAHNLALANDIQPRAPVSVTINGVYDVFLCADQTLATLGFLPAGSKPFVDNVTGVLAVDASGPGLLSLLVANDRGCDVSLRFVGLFAPVTCDVTAVSGTSDYVFGRRNDGTVSRFGTLAGNNIVGLTNVREVRAGSSFGTALVVLPTRETISGVATDVSDLLAAPIDPALPKKDRKELEKALEGILDSLAADQWLDNETLTAAKGQKTFKALEQAIDSLTKAITNKPELVDDAAFVASVEDSVLTLLGAASTLAKTALDAAALAGGNVEKLSQGVQAYQAGEALATSDGKKSASKGLGEYEKAWKKAQESLP